MLSVTLAGDDLYFFCCNSSHGIEKNTVTLFVFTNKKEVMNQKIFVIMKKRLQSGFHDSPLSYVMAGL